jgi:transcriptional regulator with XRE-family HTH domain
VYAQDFAEMLRSLMAERGIGVRELGRRVYRDKAYISRVASGKQRPSPEAARDIDDVLGASGELAALARSADSGLADVRALSLTLGPESMLAVLAGPEALEEGDDVDRWPAACSASRHCWREHW